MSRRPGQLIVKDPHSVEPQGFDWTIYLAEIGALEVIDDSTWSVTPATLTLSGGYILTGGRLTQVTLDGGVVGTRYLVTNHIITTSGIEDDRSFAVKVEDR